MNLIDLQIEFQRKIVDVNPAFEEELRPDTVTIVGYLNRAILDYLKKNFLSAQSYEQQLILINDSREDLRFLIKRGTDLLYPYGLDGQNWGTRGKRYRLPEDFMIPISLSATVTRIEVVPMTLAKQFAQFVNRRQAERLISDPSDKVIHVKPVSFIEDEFYIILVGDSYVTSIEAGEFTYIRQPDTLSFDYYEMEDDLTINLSAIPDGSYFRALSPFVYVNNVGVPTNYKAGDKVQKYIGYNSISPLSAEPVAIGYPWGETDTPDFPEYMHEDLLERATQLFLDEAKLKLVPES